MIAILGSMRVADGTELQPRDRVVLGILAVQRGAPVSTDELEDALWRGLPPTSSRKVIQGSVMRLRRSLGADAIATVEGGYRLDLADSDVDAVVFELQVERARAELSDGHAARAASRLAEALDLWRGAPLPELSEWPPAIAAVQHLHSVREAAEDLRLEAMLLAGRSTEVLADAERLAGHTPYREPRWALWARLLYSADRQADALAVLARLRRVLADELGIDPNAEVAALEVAILNQDASLRVPPAVGPLDSCPWPGLRPYEPADAERFFGRDAEIEGCLERLANSSTLVLLGGSGTGKSSLVRAGLAPRLGQYSIITPGSDPVSAMAGLDRTRTLVVDQVEEVVTQCDREEDRRAFFAALGDYPSPVVLVARADRLDQLSAYPPFAICLARGLFVLPALDEAGLRTVIEDSAARADLRLEPGLVEVLLADCSLAPASLPLLSHALSETWRRAEGNVLTVAGYQMSGGIRGAVATTADRVYAALPPEEQQRMRRLFLRMVSDEGESFRLRVPRGWLPDEWLVELLLAARLVSVVGNDELQLAHEALARHWPRLRDWLSEDREGQRLVRHLSAESRDWSNQGKPTSSLYRGVRLEAAHAWVARNPGSLTAIEAEFLEASAEEVDREIRRTQRANRRLRASLAAAIVLLVAAATGGALAVRQERAAERARDSAERANNATDALRLGTIAETRQSPTLALGLAAQAIATDDSRAARLRVLETFARFPALLSTDGDPMPPAWAPSAAKATSGRTSASADGVVRVRVDGAHVVVSRTDGSAGPSTIPTPAEVNALALDPSARLLAAGISEVGFADTGTTIVWDLRTGAELQRFKNGDGELWAHHFAPNGSTVTSYGADGLHTWDLTGSRSVVRLSNGDPATYRAGNTVLSLTDPTAGAWIDLACRLAGRQLTEAEWREHVGDRPYRPTCG